MSFLPPLCLLLVNGYCTYAQGQARTTPKGVVVESNRKELDNLLLRKPISATEDKAARQALLKQINEDFRNLQVLSNQLMSRVARVSPEIASEPRSGTGPQREIDYKYFSEMLTQIGSKASRLKSSLALPKVEAKNDKRAKVSTPEEFKSGLLVLDRLIISFATNQLFQQTNVVEIELANRASKDLNEIIDLTGRLKKGAEKIGRRG